MLWLLVFLGVTVAIQARQTSAALTARRLAELSRDRKALEAERAALERQIRQAVGRQALVARAERELGLHLPQDGEFSAVHAPASDR